MVRQPVRPVYLLAPVPEVCMNEQLTPITHDDVVALTAPFALALADTTGAPLAMIWVAAAARALWTGRDRRAVS